MGLGSIRGVVGTGLSGGLYVEAERKGEMKGKAQRVTLGNVEPR